MTSEKQDKVLPFHPDFAERVLNAADAVAARRNRTRWTAAAMFAPILAGAAMFTAWQMRAVPPAGEGRVVREFALSGFEALTPSRSAQMEPLDLLFPEARPLARFSDRYGAGSDALEDDAVFFPDAADDAAIEVDGS